MDSPRSGKGKTLVFTLALFILLVGVAEGFARLALPRPGFVATGQSIPGLLIPHPTRSYAYAPGFVGTGGNRQNQVDIAINARGLRDDPIRAGETIDVLALGNSFTAGWGVQTETAWPAVLEGELNTRLRPPDPVRVLNGGVSGYNLSQIRLHLEELLDLKPSLVVLGLPPTQYWRLENPYAYFEGQAVMSSVVDRIEVVEGGYLYSGFYREEAQRLHFWLMRNFHLGAHALGAVQKFRKSIAGGQPNSNGGEPPPEDEFASLLEELKSIHTTLVEANIGLVVLLVNQQETDGSFRDLEKELNAIVEAFCRPREVPVFDPIPHFESVPQPAPVFRMGDDFHWSQRAHALVGKELGAFLVEKGIFPPE